MSEQENLPTYSADGVDLTLIRWMLTLSPVERVRVLTSYAAGAQELRDAAAKAVRLPRTS
ncbi:MAG: hypothetical protein ACI8W8_002243 [Rhodothermales bacterium]|jgi:hypothetical protein